MTTKRVFNSIKGQMAVMGLIFSVILIAAFAIMMQPLLEFINIGVNASQNATHGAMMATMIQSLPLFITLMVLVAIVALISGRTS